jgi:putative ABC transport system permease protein
MKYFQSILEAIDSISSNKLRSSLTILGIVIGVGAVIAMMAIGQGAQDSIIGEIESIGANQFFIFSGGDAKNPEPLTLGDAEKIKESKFVLSVSSTIQGQVQMSYGSESVMSSVVGITVDYFEVEDLTLSEGEEITQVHENNNSAVVILGYGVADDLFGRTSGLLGEAVKIAGQPYRVIGVLAEEGGSRFGSIDDQVLVPLSTAQTRLIRRESNDVVDLITVLAVNSDVIDNAIDEVTQILRQQHISTLGEDDFEILNTQDFIDTASEVTDILTLVLGGIAGISLLVGGIGIMNIMLVSVIERTKEIGLRKALGARRNDILIQFLVESVLLSLVGGLIGILLGWGLSAVFGQYASIGDTPLKPVIGMDAIVLATAFSSGVGIFFGLYPANRAAKLEPVEALRSE